MKAEPYETQNVFCGNCKVEMLQRSSQGMDETIWKEYECPECKTKTHIRITIVERESAYATYTY